MKNLYWHIVQQNNIPIQFTTIRLTFNIIIYNFDECVHKINIKIIK